MSSTTTGWYLWPVPSDTPSQGLWFFLLRVAHTITRKGNPCLKRSTLQRHFKKCVGSVTQMFAGSYVWHFSSVGSFNFAQRWPYRHASKGSGRHLLQVCTWATPHYKGFASTAGSAQSPKGDPTPINKGNSYANEFKPPTPSNTEYIVGWWEGIQEAEHSHPRGVSSPANSFWKQGFSYCHWPWTVVCISSEGGFWFVLSLIKPMKIGRSTLCLYRRFYCLFLHCLTVTLPWNL